MDPPYSPPIPNVAIPRLPLLPSMSLHEPALTFVSPQDAQIPVPYYLSLPFNPYTVPEAYSVQPGPMYYAPTPSMTLLSTMPTSTFPLPLDRLQSSIPLTKKRRRQVASACVHCAAGHLSCSENRPCDRCVRRGLECVDRAKKKPRVDSPVPASDDAKDAHGPPTNDPQPRKELDLKEGVLPIDSKQSPVIIIEGGETNPKGEKEIGVKGDFVDKKVSVSASPRAPTMTPIHNPSMSTNSAVPLTQTRGSSFEPFVRQPFENNPPETPREVNEASASITPHFFHFAHANLPSPQPQVGTYTPTSALHIPQATYLSKNYLPPKVDLRQSGVPSPHGSALPSLHTFLQSLPKEEDRPQGTIESSQNGQFLRL